MSAVDPVVQNLNHFNSLSQLPLTDREDWTLGLLREASRLLSPNSEILVVAPDTREIAELWRALGHEVELLMGSGDPRWIPTIRDNWDAAWVTHWFNFLPKPACQRLLGALFLGLRPGGLLITSLWTQSPPAPLAGAPHFYEIQEADFASLLLQSGFETIKIGRTPSPQAQTAWILKRVGASRLN